MLKNDQTIRPDFDTRSGAADEPSSDIPALSVRSVRLRGVEDLREAVRGADLRVVQLVPGSLQGNLIHAKIGNIFLSAGDFGLDIRARGVMNPDLVTVGMMLESSGQVSQWDYDVVPGDVVLFPKSVEQEGYFTGYSRYATISISAEDLAAHSAGEPRLQDPDFWTRIFRSRPPLKLREQTRREIAERIAQLRAGEFPRSPGAVEFLRRSLIEAFLEGIIQEASEEYDERHYPGARLVRDVEDYVDAAGADRPLHISELCSALDVPRRTLHRAFHDTLGTGPVAYLRLRRLSSVRRALRTANPQARVTQTALDHGFTDLGRFAGYYRDTFGERPSQTRQQAMADFGISQLDAHQ